MNKQRIGRSLPGVLAGTVLVGTLAFAAQIQSQQSSTQERPARSAEQRGPGGRGGPGQRNDSLRVERRLGMLTERLTLTANQQAAVRTILLDEHTQVEALRPEGGRGFGGPRGARPDSGARVERQRPDSAQMAQRRAEMEQVRAKMDVLRQQTDTRIEQVLTADQRATYRELVANRPEGGPGRGGRGGPGGRGGRGRGAEQGGQRTPPPATR
jgi:Spy/CpxP family protein refolding chaperone